ncbi:hypothetical protein RMATCC62417_13606 [Rhizopus microsporus]|nr:hypothetical protein RMATCC62417_13606 [Rhizopus microsporus]
MNMCRVALGSDTGGSVRMPASYCGIVGFKPSYGRCSRYGLVAYANSLDTIGILSRTVEDCANVYNAISKYDALDPTSMPLELRNEIDEKDKELASRWEKDLSGLVVGIPQEFYVDSLSPKVISAWREGIDRFKQLGAKIITVSMPHTPLALPAYYIIALAEASSNLARYDGVNTRTQGFGAEVQRRILLGTHVLTAGTYETLFLPAQKARRLIQQDFNHVFCQPNPLMTHECGQAHLMLIPSATGDAPTLKEQGMNEYINDVMTLPANLAGVPAITVPFIKDDHPIGLQLMSQYGYDQFLLSMAQKIQ